MQLKPKTLALKSLSLARKIHGAAHVGGHHEWPVETKPSPKVVILGPKVRGAAHALKSLSLARRSAVQPMWEPKPNQTLAIKLLSLARCNPCGWALCVASEWEPQPNPSPKVVIPGPKGRGATHVGEHHVWPMGT
jgi:hypothetical protein